jgi:arylformamidase
MIFDTYRVIELSHQLYPGKEEYHYDLRRDYVEEFIPHYRGKRPENQWYIMSEVKVWSHVGTHMEAPYHYQQDGVDIAGIPLKQVVGECAFVDLTGKAVGEPISLAELQARGAHIRPGDIVFIYTGYGHLYRTPNSHDRPYFEPEAIRWLAEDMQIACLGVDCSGTEDRNQPQQPNHKMLFDHGIPLIEHLANMDQVTKPRLFVVAVPLRLHQCDASPLSVIAFEPLD